MTKLISLLIVLAVCFLGWRLFLYWDKVKNEEAQQAKQAAASVIQAESLPGLPPHLEAGLKAAQLHGTAAVRQWLKSFGAQVQDPRKAWIELEYCKALTREDPAEARRVFAEVKQRTPPSSPIWPQVKELEKSFQ